MPNHSRTPWSSSSKPTTSVESRLADPNTHNSSNNSPNLQNRTSSPHLRTVRILTSKNSFELQPNGQQHSTKSNFKPYQRHQPKQLHEPQTQAAPLPLQTQSSSRQ
ncbi:hypothetical protein Droror1_Dr00004751 [Drosera rotundifolia]